MWPSHPPIPEVSFIPERFAGTSAAASIAGTVRANPSLDLNPDIEINQVSFEPEAVLNTDDQLVVTATDEIIVSVVVANVGNVPRRGGQLRVRLEDGEGDVVESMSAAYPELDARASTSVSFDPMPVEPGADYVLIITLVAGDGEQNLENNVEEVRFLGQRSGLSRLPRYDRTPCSIRRCCVKTPTGSVARWSGAGCKSTSTHLVELDALRRQARHAAEEARADQTGTRQDHRPSRRRGEARGDRNRRQAGRFLPVALHPGRGARCRLSG